MAIYHLENDELTAVEETTFSKAGVRERDNLQRLLIKQIDIISPGTLVISEEFGDWEDSRRRIDVLGIDKDANLVVIELKRTEDGGHMELQALRYAAMISAMTFGKAMTVFEDFLESHDQEGDARQIILDFLEWDDVDDVNFAQEVRIVLASADFSKELTTAVIWLNEHGTNIKCIRLKPYKDGSKTLLDVQQVIPLPEQEEYQVKIRHKAQLERVSRIQNRDFTKYDIQVGDLNFAQLPKRRAIFHVVKFLCDSGIDPEEIRAIIDWRYDALRDVDGNLGAKEFSDALTKQLIKKGKKAEPERYFIGQDQLIYANGKTYALTKMWGKRTEDALERLVNNFKQFDISFEAIKS